MFESRRFALVSWNFTGNEIMAKSAPTDCEQAALDNDILAMAGAEILLKSLEDEDVEVIFGYPGGAVLPIYDALFKNNKIRHILVRHEQAAVHALRATLGQLARLALFW